MFKKMFEQPKGQTKGVSGIVERCSVQYTPNYGAFLILIEGDDRIYSIGPDQYIHPALHLTQPGDEVKIVAREDISQCTRDKLTLWRVHRFVNHTLEQRLGREIPRWERVKDEQKN